MPKGVNVMGVHFMSLILDFDEAGATFITANPKTKE